MIRDDIFGTLKTALQRGKNLQQTVQSLINSGYSKEDVDDSLQVLQGSGFQTPNQPPIIRRVTVPAKQAKTLAPSGPTVPVVSSYAYPSSQPQAYQSSMQAQQPLPPQFYQPKPGMQIPASQIPAQFYQPMPYQPAIPGGVSNYEAAPGEQLGRMITVIMVAMLIALVGILVVVFMFREELTNFINNL